MLRISYKLRLNESVRAKCERHPAYDPSEAGKDYIADRCSTCKEIFDVYEAKVSLDRAVKTFLMRVEPWRKSGRIARSIASSLTRDPK